MPWGLTRFQHSGQSHFVTFCCYHRRRLLTTDESCRIFELVLERVRRSYRLCVYGYVVMPEHVHLLLSEPQTAPLKPKDGLNGPPTLGETQLDTLADALKSLKQGVARRLLPPQRTKCARRGPRFDWRCGAFLAKAVLRFQHSQLSAVCGEAALHSSQSGGWPIQAGFGLSGDVHTSQT